MNLKDLETELIIKRREARREYKCHFAAASECRKSHNVYGILATLLALVAGSTFAAKLLEYNPIFNWIIPLLTLFAAIFAALITYNKYLEKAEQHHQLAREWEEYRDDCSGILIEFSFKPNIIDSEFDHEELLLRYQALTNKRKKIRQRDIGYPKKFFKKFENIKDKVELIDS